MSFDLRSKISNLDYPAIMCILPLTSLVASEAMAASKKPQRSDLTSNFNSVTSITYVPMSLWLPKASMS